MLFLDRENGVGPRKVSAPSAGSLPRSATLPTIARSLQNLFLDRSTHRDVSKSRDHRGVEGLFGPKPCRQRWIAFQARDSLLERRIVPVFRAVTVGLQQPFDLALLHFPRPMPRRAPGEFAPAIGVAKLSPAPDVRRPSQVATPGYDQSRLSLVARSKTD